MFSDDVDARAVATGVATPGRELDLRVDGEVPQRFRVGMDARYEIPVTPPGPGRHDAHVVYAD
ncbi:hypothetical protein ACPEEZ_03115 [Frigoribacterium sp. 2-23]|uniref:hypothetical protein n=1 Tax=Frigoribacterium sp. 2-23 TaxID=3415006 RepID=UPI003C6F72AD